jgi:DNA-3-methyladenine glycosylase I
MPSMSKILKRCNWCGDDPLYQSYHDEEWGVPLYDDQQLFEFLLLEGAQAGLSWITILKKRESYREAFDNFKPDKIARYTEKKQQKLLLNEGIVRNKLKVTAFTKNAKAFLSILESHNNFSEFIWQFVDGQPIQNQWKDLKSIPASTPESEQMSKTLKRAGFSFVGPTICYAFMQATGMVNDHLVDCFRYQQVKKL